MTDETLDVLSRTLRIYQRRRGHRATSDDVLVAGIATSLPEPARILDLGTGKGTVALLLARAWPQSTLVGVEAFEQSHALAVRNTALNDLSHQFSPLLGDLRDQAVLIGQAPFDLICGAPPFMPLGTGILPQDAQRAAGRFELRGGVEAYAACAALHLSLDGRLVLLMDGHSVERTREAIRAAALYPQQEIRICPRPSAPATYFAIVAARQPAVLKEKTLAMRLETGEDWSPAYQALRLRLDLPTPRPKPR